MQSPPPFVPSGVPVSLRVRVLERDFERFPLDDDRLGDSLWSMLADRIGKPVAPALFVFRAEQVDILEIGAVLRAGHPFHSFVSAAAGQAGVESVAVLGTPAIVQRGQQVGQAAVAFLEWPDNRWWHAYQPLDPRFAPISEMPRDVRRAIDGLPRPGGLGAWFSTARFHRLSLKLERREESAEPPMVH